MAKSFDVLEMLCEGVEYVCRGLEYEDIDWLGQSPAITKTQFEAGFAKFDSWKIAQDKKESDKKQAILDRLGITAEEAALLLK